jgi:hypothetical protein
MRCLRELRFAAAQTQENDTMPALWHTALDSVHPEHCHCVPGRFRRFDQAGEYNLVAGMGNARNILEQEPLSPRLFHEAPELIDQ